MASFKKYNEIELADSEKENFPLWDFCPASMEADIANFDKTATGYAVYSTGATNEINMQFLLDLVPAIKESGNKFRFHCYEKDQLAFATWSALKGGREAYKPYAKFENYVPVACQTPTYDAHGITAHMFEFYSEALGNKASSGLREQREAIMDDTTKSDSEKAMEIARLKPAEGAGGTPKFSSVQPSTRGMKANMANILLGADCVSPVKFVVLDSPDGATTLAEMKANKSQDVGDTSRFIGLQIATAEYYGLPVFNLSKDGDKERLTAFVAEL